MAILQMGEGVQVFARLYQDIAAAAAITAIGSAERHVLLTPEVRHAVAAAPGPRVVRGLWSKKLAVESGMGPTRRRHSAILPHDAHRGGGRW